MVLAYLSIMSLLGCICKPSLLLSQGRYLLNVKLFEL